jgi:Protein of unknown function (DUF3305)
MKVALPLETIPVGVVVERTKGTSAWVDYLWRASAVLAGVPDTPVWSKLSDDGERATFYAGAANIELHRTETTNYRDNLATGQPLLWVVLRKTESEPPYKLFAVLADPAEGEAMTEADNDLVDTVAMPEPVQETLAAFIEAHHVEREFVKRKRDRANKEALAKRDGER